jgi:hypothetical protein
VWAVLTGVPCVLLWPGVRRAGLPRLSPPLTPGQRRRRRRIDPDKAQFGSAVDLNGPKRRPVLFDHVVKLWCRCGGFWSLRSVTVMDHRLQSAWNGSWNGALDNPSAASAVSAKARTIRAASAPSARGRTSCKRQVSGSIPLTGSQVRRGFGPAGARIDKCRLHHANTIDNVRKRPMDRAA